MKNLFYLSALCGIILLGTSCTKGELVGPKNSSDTSTKTGPLPHCDSVKLISYVLTNLTGNISYEITFSGAQTYVFTFLPYGNRTVSVKSGTYSIAVLTPMFGDYPHEQFQLNNHSVVIGSSAHYDDIELSPCSGPQSFSITP